MDFEFLSGSYKRYKADTTKFCTWLSEQAAACGHLQRDKFASAADDAPSTSALGERLQGKAARKAMKREAKKSTSEPEQSNPPSVTKITTRELILQAKTVANSKVKMPTAMVEVLGRAIQARKRCSQVFQAAGGPKDEKSTGRHIHFIGILEQTMEILAPCVEEEWEDIDGEDDDEDGENHNHSPDSYSAHTTDNTARECPQVELEENDHDQGFAAFCFFEDMHRMEDYIKSIWEEYKEGKIDVLTASFIANAAIDIIRTQEIEVSEFAMPGHHLCFGELVLRTIAGNMVPGEYSIIAAVLKEKMAKGEKATLTDEEMAEIRQQARQARGEEDELTEEVNGLPSSSTPCERYPVPLPPADFWSEKRKEERREEGYEESSMQEFGDTDSFFYRWTGYIQIKNHECWDGTWTKWLEGPSNGEITSIAWDFDNKKSDLRDMPRWKEILADDYFLTEMASEILLNNHYQTDAYAGEARGLSRLGNRVKGLSPELIPDRYVEEVLELPRGKRATRRELSACFIFASQIMLDIHHILGDRSKEVCEELAASMNKAENSLRMKFKEVGEDFSREGLNEKDTLAAKILTRASNSANRKPIYTGQLVTPEKSRMLVRLSDSIDRSVTRHWDLEKKKAMQDIRGMNVKELRFFPYMSYEQLGIFWDDWSKTRRSEDFAAIATIDFVDPKTGVPVIFSGAPMKVPAAKHRYLISQEPFFFIHNPTNCGTRLLELNLNMEEAGLAITNHHMAILWVAHFYNSARQLGSLEMPWPEMDRIIELHLSTLFCGSLPKEGDQFFKRLTLAMGVKPSNWKSHERAKHRHERFKWEGGIGEGPKLLPTKTSAILRKLGDKNDPLTLQQSLWRINSLIEENSKKKNKQGQTQLTPIELLQRIRNWFPTFVQDMQIDYIELNRKCSEILWRIRMTILVELNIDHPVMSKPADRAAEPGFLRMALRIFGSTHVYEFKKKRSQNCETEEMQIVGNVFRKFLETR